jgi:Copper amine oxidase N-terminal domain
MASTRPRFRSALPAAAGLACLLAAPALAAGPLTVQVNGVPANLNPAPTERAGRVFVPLRGVFEQLGATVVYDAGAINATGRRHTVSLHVGSLQAVVDNQPQTLDVAPFIIGASTYVPLRFVSQALGAQVNYDGTNEIVAINTDRGSNPVTAPPNAPPPVDTNAAGGNTITLDGLSPARGAVVHGDRPTIQASFAGGTVDPNSVRVVFDGRDVTGQAYVSPRGMTYTPPGPIPADRHSVRISGRDRAGVPFERGWTFSSGGAM